MKKISKVLITSLIFVLCICVFQSTVKAETLGTISFKALNNKDTKLIQNLQVSIYQVQIRNENGSFEYTKGFKDCNLNLNDLSESNLEKLKTYANQNAEPMYTKTTDKQGRFELTSLSLGVYLFVQQNKTEEYTMQTMLVTIPELTTQNGLEYNLDVVPKIIDKETVDENNQNKDILVDDENLPYSGVLSWPVPVLVILAIAIFCIAWLQVYTNNKKKIK